MTTLDSVKEESELLAFGCCFRGPAQTKQTGGVKRTVLSVDCAIPLKVDPMAFDGSVGLVS